MSDPGGPEAIVVMARDPRPGGAKTRLIPGIGPEASASIARAMVRDTLDLVARTCHDGRRGHVAVDGPLVPAIVAEASIDATIVHQRGTGLAERLTNAMCDLSAAGHRAVVALGSDCPHLPDATVVAAFAALADDPDRLVLAPAADGGYVLVGWATPRPHIVGQVTMSTPDVLADTVARARGAGVEVALLDPCFDIDEPADLARLRDDRAASARAPRTAALAIELVA